MRTAFARSTTFPSMLLHINWLLLLNQSRRRRGRHIVPGVLDESDVQAGSVGPSRSYWRPQAGINPLRRLAYADAHNGAAQRSMRGRSAFWIRPALPRLGRQRELAAAPGRRHGVLERVERERDGRRVRGGRAHAQHRRAPQRRRGHVAPVPEHVQPERDLDRDERVHDALARAEASASEGRGAGAVSTHGERVEEEEGDDDAGAARPEEDEKEDGEEAVGRR